MFDPYLLSHSFFSTHCVWISFSLFLSFFLMHVRGLSVLVNASVQSFLYIFLCIR